MPKLALLKHTRNYSRRIDVSRDDTHYRTVNLFSVFISSRPAAQELVVMRSSGFVSESRHDSTFVTSTLFSKQLQSKKNVCVFLPLQRNRELKVLCSSHSIPFEAEATRSDARGSRMVSRLVMPTH